MFRNVALALVAVTSLAAAMTSVSARGVQHLQSHATVSNAGGNWWQHYCYKHPYECLYR